MSDGTLHLNATTDTFQKFFPVFTLTTDSPTREVILTSREAVANRRADRRYDPMSTPQPGAAIAVKQDPAQESPAMPSTASASA
eukprot:12284874-Heterocapsa_arctica.AAC.1